MTLLQRLRLAGLSVHHLCASLSSTSPHTQYYEKWVYWTTHAESKCTVSIPTFKL